MSDADLFAAWEAQIEFDQEGFVEDFSALGELDLVRRLNEVDSELTKRGELIHQTTDRGRELHSLRAAIIVVIHNRR